MKPIFLSQVLRHKYWNVLSFVSITFGVLTLISQCTPEFEETAELIIGILAVVALLVGFIFVFVRYNTKKSLEMKINNINVEVITGDIFLCEGWKVIAFNEYFDTVVDDKIISRKSLNGQYITKTYGENIEVLDTLITSCKEADKMIIDTASERKYGKQQRYELGTVIPDGEYFLTAFSKFDAENRAYLGIDDYVRCILNLWQECNIYYAEKDINLPLLGSGITRITNCRNIDEQELLELLLWLLENCEVNFSDKCVIRFVLTGETMQKIDLNRVEYHLKCRNK